MPEGREVGRRSPLPAVNHAADGATVRATGTASATIYENDKGAAAAALDLKHAAARKERELLHAPSMWAIPGLLATATRTIHAKCARATELGQDHTVADRELQVPAHRPQDHLRRELPALERALPAAHHRVTSTPKGLVFTRSPSAGKLCNGTPPAAFPCRPLDQPRQRFSRLGATPRSDVHCIGRCTRCDGWCDAVARDVATAVRRPLLDAVLPWCDCCNALLPLKRVVRRWCDGGVLPATWSADDALLRLGGGHSSLLAEPWWRTTTTHARNLWPFG